MATVEGHVSEFAGRWHLRLYVAGQSARGDAALANLRAICDEHLAGRCDLEVVDLLERPQRGPGDHIIAIPTLERCVPAPARTIIGDLSDRERVLLGLDLLALT